MFKPNKYQKRILKRLEEFFVAVLPDGPAAAYRQVAYCKDENDERENPYALDYHPPIEELADRPHVCARIPTGGGKTYMAAKTLRILNAYRQSANPFRSPKPPILWIVPSNTIREQTVAMLQDRDHPCGNEIRSVFGNNFPILDIANFDNLNVGRIDSGFLIVSTAAMFAVRETTRNKDDDGMTKATRRIYASNECFDPHFARLLPTSPTPPDAEADGLHLEYDASGKVKKSFVNLLHLLRPIVVLDEAHRFVGDLSREVLRRINPSCIMEWTATPRDTKDDRQLHNILVSATAQELQDEEMIKLPFAVGEHDNWGNAVQAAVQERAKLAKIAAAKDSQVRPIVLYKATDINGDAPPEKLKHHLMDVHKVPEGEIAIQTGEIRELDGVDVAASNFNHIITVEALREGWDCPFAYVFCSADNIQSQTPVEQFLGRVMRMPFAKKRPADELNKAYAHMPSEYASAALEVVHKKLSTDMGFDEREAEQMVVEQGALSDEPLWDSPFHVQTETKPDFSHLEEEEKKEAEAAVQAEPNETGDGWTVKIKDVLSPKAQEAIINAVAEKKRPQQERRMHHAHQRHSIAVSPARKNKKFADLPQLMFYSPEREENTEVSGETLYELARWNEIGDDCILSDFSIQEKGRMFEVFLQKGKVQSVDKGVYTPPLLEETMSPERLVAWLVREIRDPEKRIDGETLRRMTENNLAALTDKKITVEQIWRGRNQLADALRNLLKKHMRKVARETAEEFLFGDKELWCDLLPRFAPDFNYRAHCGSLYSGGYQFNKHYYGAPGDLKSSGEEFECAKAIDMSRHVRHWIRNVDRQRNAYALPLSAGKNFYPDFVVELDNGKTLIVEYKGAFLLNKEAEDKRRVGEKLQKASEGKCFFAMPTREEGQTAADIYRQVNAAIKKAMAA